MYPAGNENQRNSNRITKEQQEVGSGIKQNEKETLWNTEQTAQNGKWKMF